MGAKAATGAIDLQVGSLDGIDLTQLAAVALEFP